MNLLFLLFLGVLYQAQGLICSINLLNKTKKYLFIQVQPTRVNNENSSDEMVNAELDFDEKNEVFYKCANPNGHAKVTIAEVMDGRYTEYPYMQDVFGNKTYVAIETRIKSVRLKPTSNKAYMAKSDVENKILKIEKRLDGQMELINRLIDAEVPPGPQGPQGPQGPPGPEGQPGKCDSTLQAKIDELLRLQADDRQTIKLQNHKLSKLEADFKQKNQAVQSNFSDELVKELERLHQAQKNQNQIIEVQGNELAELKAENDIMSKTLAYISVFMSTLNIECGTNVAGEIDCTCQSGYGKKDGVCQDIDECLNVSSCGTNFVCINSEGSFSCECKTGFFRNDFACEDIDECATANECDSDAACKNTVGSYECVCLEGFSGDGKSCGVKTHVLVLTTQGSKVPSVIDGKGGSRQPRFEFGPDTESQNSCSLLWRGQFYIYGGANKKDQISKVSGCRLQRIGSLSFELVNGGCATDPAENIYLCFGEAATKTCRKSQNPAGDFTQITQSTFEHEDTRISASSKFLFVAGSNEPSHNKAELFSFDKESWRTTISYPYGNEISYVFIVNKGEDFYIFGGWDGSHLDRVVKFTTANESWTQIGSLNKARSGHGVIQTGESFLVVGGVDVLPTEKCDLDAADRITCVTMEPTLGYIYNYPEILLVETDYCS